MMPGKLSFFFIGILVSAGIVPAVEPVFIPVKVDGPVHDPVRHSYWFGPFSECASVLDVDGDGDLDITAGRNWYEAPKWIKHENFRPGAETNGPETDDNSEFALDVNRDGRPDIVSSGWMRMKGVFWYENPGRNDVRWTGRRLHSARSLEGVIHGDIDGDGDDDILCNHWTLQPGQGMTWLEAIDQEPWFVEHVIGTEGEKHGNGLGDINGDGRTDIVTPLGWYENPPESANGKWKFHPDDTFKSSASHPLLVHDVNEDGRNDVIIGTAHDYGLVWLEQTANGSFRQHYIERDFGGFHTMAMGDLTGDGQPELVTGKRLFPHHGRDTSAYDPLFVFWYKIDKGEFERHILSYNHLPWYPGRTNVSPAPNYAIGTGMKINIADMDGNGRNDVVLAGKGGLYILYNEGTTPRPKPERILPEEELYPSWRHWQEGRPAPRAFVWLFDGRDLSHWTTTSDHWVVEDGTIALKDRSDGKEHNDSYLWTKQVYGDFVLDLEYKAPAGRANSGIFLRTSDRDDPVYTGIEVQVGNPNPRRGLSRNVVGGIYDLVAPAKQLHRVGEWNRYTITCEGSKIRVVLNGELSAEADLEQWRETGQNPDGSKNKFKQPLKDFAREGHVGLQDHGRAVWYRNIRIKPLGQ